MIKELPKKTIERIEKEAIAKYPISLSRHTEGHDYNKQTRSIWIEGSKSEALRSLNEIEKLQAFKDYVHKRLDDAGIPKDPESPHKEAGCRIGGRLDIILSEIEKLKEENKKSEIGLASVIGKLNLQVNQLESQNKELMEALKEVKQYWRFDNNQQPLSSWHDLQDYLIKIESLLKGQ